MIKKRLLLSSIALLLSLSSCSKEQNPAQNEQKPSNIAPIINSAHIPTYVFYFAKWCQYCHKMAPIVKKASEEFENKVYFHYIDVDSPEGKEFSKKYRPNGRGIPYSQFYSSTGMMAGSKLGVVQYDDLVRVLSKLQ